MSEQNQSEIIIYQTEDGLTRVNVTFSDETVWLSQQQIAELFQKSRTTIVEHIHNIYKEGELEEASTCRNYRQVQTEGSREVSRTIPFYNLDMIISVGYRVKSRRGVQFRIWAGGIIKEYMRKGFAMDDLRLKELGGRGYFHELMERKRNTENTGTAF